MVLSPIYSTGLTTQLRYVPDAHLYSGTDICLGYFVGIGTPATIFVSALLTFLFCAGIARLIALLPKSKYLIG